MYEYGFVVFASAVARMFFLRPAQHEPVRGVHKFVAGGELRLTTISLDVLDG